MVSPPKRVLKSPSEGIIHENKLYVHLFMTFTIARPYNEDYNSRFFAAHVLSYSIDNDEHILRLYWLAIKEVYGASGQYRGAIYRAIYRSETARSRKQQKGNK